MKARKKVKMVDPELVTLKNGRKALKGKSIETGISLFRIISLEDAEKFLKIKLFSILEKIN